MLLITPVTWYTVFLYEKRRMEFADALCKTILLSQIFVLVTNNLLSFFHALTGSWIFLCYLAVFLWTMYLYGRRYGSVPAFWPAGSKKKPVTPPGDRFLCGVFFLSVLIMAIVLLYGAVFTVPYNYDSMTYHLARVGHWIDHRSVAHYTSNIDRQIYSPVLAEYNLLQIMLLGGNDTFVNFLQYASLLAAAYFIYAILQKLGTSRLSSYFGAFVFFFMPLTISQAITTQNDLFAALILLLFLYELLDVIYAPSLSISIRSKKPSRQSAEHAVHPAEGTSQTARIARLGIWVGLAYLAKTSVCASQLFFLPWLFLVCVKRKDKIRDLFFSVCIAAAAILVTIAETLLRTFHSGGKLMMDTASGDIMVATKNISYILVNILKNYSLLITQHLYRPLNGFVYRLAIGLGEKLHVEVNNEAIAFHGFDFLRHMNMGEDMYSHDKTPSAFAAYLAFFGGILLLILLIQCLHFQKKNKTLPKGEHIDIKEPSRIVGFGISAWLSFGFIMALLRWQPWGSRLMYPALVATIPAAVSVLDFYLRHAKRTTAYTVLSVLGLLAFTLAIPSVSYNLREADAFLAAGCRNRMDRYYENNHQEAMFRRMSELAKEDGAKRIGLSISGDGYDYPLWLEFHTAIPDARLEHVIFSETGTGLKEDTAHPPFGGRDFDALLFSQKGTHTPGDTVTCGGATFLCIEVSEDQASAYYTRQ